MHPVANWIRAAITWQGMSIGLHYSSRIYATVPLHIALLLPEFEEPDLSRLPPANEQPLG